MGRYEQSEWGWKEREKREELRDDRAWYLIARESGAGPVAFSHFRFDVECGDEVLYWWVSPKWGKKTQKRVSPTL